MLDPLGSAVTVLRVLLTGERVGHQSEPTPLTLPGALGSEAPIPPFTRDGGVCLSGRLPRLVAQVGLEHRLE